MSEADRAFLQMVSLIILITADTLIIIGSIREARNKIIATIKERR